MTTDPSKKKKKKILFCLIEIPKDMSVFDIPKDRCQMYKHFLFLRLFLKIKLNYMERSLNEALPPQIYYIKHYCVFWH